MTTPERERLAAAQAELLRALVAGGTVPGGFPRDRVTAQAEALVAKRQRIVVKLRPELAAELGNRLTPLFREYASQHPRRTGTTATADAAAFYEWLVAREEITRTRRGPMTRLFISVTATIAGWRSR